MKIIASLENSSPLGENRFLKIKIGYLVCLIRADAMQMQTQQWEISRDLRGLMVNVSHMKLYTFMFETTLELVKFNPKYGDHRPDTEKDTCVKKRGPRVKSEDNPNLCAFPPATFSKL